MHGTGPAARVRRGEQLASRQVRHCRLHLWRRHDRLQRLVEAKASRQGHVQAERDDSSEARNAVCLHVRLPTLHHTSVPSAIQNGYPLHSLRYIDDKTFWHSAKFGSKDSGGGFRGAIVFRWLTIYRLYRCDPPYTMVLTEVECGSEVRRKERAEIQRRARERARRNEAEVETLTKSPAAMQAEVQRRQAEKALPQGVNMLTRTALRAQRMPTACEAVRALRAARGRGKEAQ